MHALIFDHSELHENSKFARVILEVNFPALKCECAKCMQHKEADGFLSWICLLLNYIGTLSHEVYGLITILLKNTGVIPDSYKMEDDVENKFVS